MTNPMRPSRETPGLPTPPKGWPIGSYGTYAEAQRAVDFLSDENFTVQDVTIVGVDLMPLLTKSLSSTLPQGDPYFETVRPMPLVDRMIADGFTGRKGKGGFYRFDKATKTKLALDLATGTIAKGSSPPRCRPRRKKTCPH